MVRRRRQKGYGTDAFADTRDEWTILGANGVRVARYSYGPLALSEAQNLAQRVDGNDTVTLLVRRQTIGGSGGPVPIYRVERDAEGTIRTYTLSKED